MSAQQQLMVLDADGVKNVAAKLLAWPADVAATATLSLMPGGATGATFLLAPARGEEAPAASVVVRNLRVASPSWVPGVSPLRSVSDALGAAGVGAAVIAASDDVIVHAMVRGRAMSIDDVIVADGEVPGVVANKAAPAAAAPQAIIAAVAKVVALLHQQPAGAETADVFAAMEAAAADDGTPVDLDNWRRRSFAAVAAEAAGNDSAAVAGFRAAVDSALASCAEFSPYHAPEVATGFAHLSRGATAPPVVAVTHGDLHLGNMLLSAPASPSDATAAAAAVAEVKLVDLDRALPRRAATDLAYLFMTWADQYHQRGYNVAAHGGAPPVIPATTRRLFAREYLGTTAAADDEAAIDALLLEIEVAMYAERLRFFLILTLLAGGKFATPLGGYGAMGFSMVLPPALALLRRLRGEDDEAARLRRAVVERGLFATAAAEAAAAAAAPTV